VEKPDRPAATPRPHNESDSRRSNSPVRIDHRMRSVDPGSVVRRRIPTCTSRNGARPWWPGRHSGHAGPHARHRPAAMEPGRGGREDLAGAGRALAEVAVPQWSPAVVAGKTSPSGSLIVTEPEPQWSPAMVAGKTRHADPRRHHRRRAAMEPGHGGREDDWGVASAACPGRVAAMEPGHGGREDLRTRVTGTTRRSRPQWSPAMVAGKT
jgi:hypothetical protein